jgi:hypothetical protein
MERNLNNDFERFLKENADQYRLYPSANVWKGIYSALHSRRKWFGLGTILLLITGTLVTLLITNSPKQTVIPNNQPIEVSKQVPASALRQSSHKSVTLSNTRSASTKLPTFAAVSVSERSLYNETSDNLVAPGHFFNNEFVDNFAPLSYNLTDELTDQDMAGIMSRQKTLDYSNADKSATARPFDWTIESVLNGFSPLTQGHRKFSLQFNFTPTISYRKLSGNNSFLRSSTLQSAAPSYYAPLYDINNVVTHKPDIGLEFGVSAKYALATNFKVKGGIQFNINRYDIKAFNYPFEVAKIALRGNSGVDSFYTVSTHRNYGGYKSDWLQNFYFEISMPVGIEVNLMGDDKVQFGVAGTIQPTYVIGDRAYLLSTDYKNYALVPWLIRRWNASTAFETFVSYSTGKMKWQVGPQVRYQLLSSFIDQYPVKENLFDFGLKVGVSVNK